VVLIVSVRPHGTVLTEELLARDDSGMSSSMVIEDPPTTIVEDDFMYTVPALKAVGLGAPAFAAGLFTTALGRFAMMALPAAGSFITLAPGRSDAEGFFITALAGRFFGFCVFGPSP